MSGVDGHGQPTFLYVTDTQRKREVVEREFLRWRSERPVFAPRVRVLTELLEELYLRHGAGRAILPDRVVALVAEQVLAEGGDDWPWLRSLGGGPVVGEALARLHRQLAEARRPPLEVPHAAELVAALAVLEDRLATIPGFVPYVAALDHLLVVLESPPPAMVQWLRATHSVVIDDVLQLSPLRRAVLVALCRAWEASGTHVVLAFETGRDLGGREVEAFFEYGDVDEVALPLKPFSATRALRRTLFEAVVAQGDGRITLARHDEVVAVEPWSTPGSVEAPDLSDLVYEPGCVPVDSRDEARALLGGRVRLLRCDDPDAELRAIARDVKRVLLDGEQPGECVVALPDLATYAPAVRAVFEDHGIPFALGAGARLAHSPVANLVRRCLHLALDGWPVDALFAMAASEFVERPQGVDVAGLRQAAAGAGLRSGRPHTWATALRSWEQRTRRAATPEGDLHRTLAWLDDICESLAPLADAATPGDHRTALLHIIDVLGVSRRVGRGSTPRVLADNLHAWAAVRREIDAWVRDATVAAPGPWPAEGLGEHLDAALHAATYAPEAFGPSRVQIVGALELRGLTPHRIWLGGLHRNAFPAPRGGPFLLPPAFERSLDPVDPLAEARYLLGSLLRNTLDDGQTASLVLSWPATLEGKPLAPSPVLADLLDRPTGDAAGALLGDWIVDTPEEDGEVLARSDALRAAAVAPRAWSSVLSEADAALASVQREAWRARREPDPGEWEGVLCAKFPVGQPLAVTRLETYLKCPARYAYAYVLGLKALRAWEPELDPLRRGTAVHDILHRFLRARDYRPLRGEPDREGAAHALHAVATEVLDEVERGGGMEAALVAEQRRRWLGGLIDDEPAGVLRAWLDHEVDDDLDLVPVATEASVGPIPLGPVSVKGTIDRLDRFRTGGWLVTDYKTGTPPRGTDVLRGLALQPVLYADAVAREHPGEPVAGVYYQVKRPEHVGRTGWVVDPALARHTGRQREVRLDPINRGALLDHAAQGARRLLDGVFHPTLATRDEARCDQCDFRRICRWSADRAAELAEGEADVQRPLEIA